MHKDAEKIGYKNWQNFEVAQSVENGNKLIVVNLPDSTDAPDECYGHGAIWAGKYSQENIIKGLDEAAKK